MANHSDFQLEALGRIIGQVKAFRGESENLKKSTYSLLLTRHLRQRLSAQDWALWQELQIDWEHSK